MDIQIHKLTTVILAWCLVPSLLGFSKSNDPILKYMCIPRSGSKFWRDFLECSVVLDSQILTVLNVCIPVSNHEEAEKTRCSICNMPDRWIKMMDCMNVRLIELQDESNPHLELSPGSLYRTCVSVLVQEAERSSKNQKPFMPEDNRTISSNCSDIY